MANKIIDKYPFAKNMNIFQFAATIEHAFENNLESINKLGLNKKQMKRNYTWTSDFAIAMVFGEKAINETYDNAVKFWSKDAECITELAFSLNFLTWFCYNFEDMNNSKIFSDLYYKLIYTDAKNGLTQKEYSDMMWQLD